MSISTNSIILKPKEFKHLKNDYSWRKDEELSKLDAVIPIEMSFDEFRRINDPRNKNIDFSFKSYNFAIETSDEIHIGNCMIYNIKPIFREGELGIMIGNKNYWDQSFGQQAMNKLIKFMFNKTKIEHLYLHTLTSNIRAQKCFQKAGFRKTTQVKRSNGLFFKMELTKKKWLEINN
jgi:RimJ/RimL family protein N-acetyltransferase